MRDSTERSRGRRAANRPDADVHSALTAAISTARSHFVDETSRGRHAHQPTRARHIQPRRAALTITATALTVVLAAVTYWLVDPTSSHNTTTDPAVTALRTYEAALDGTPEAVTARDRHTDQYVITDDPEETRVGYTSPVTGTCWVLRIPATGPTSIRTGPTSDCARVPVPAPTPTDEPPNPASGPGGVAASTD